MTYAAIGVLLIYLDRRLRLGRGNVFALYVTNDPIIPTSGTKALAELLSKAGADVAIRFFQAGHELTMADVESAREWLTTLE